MLHPSILADLGIPASLISARGLQPFAEATSLEIAEIGADDREYFLTPPAATAWRQMKYAAARNNIQLSIISAFRSIERQVEIVRRKLETGESLEQILKVSAPPGYSEHHTGRAVDISTPDTEILSIDFAQTPAFHWLMQHGGEFQFTLSYPPDNPQGFVFEPWHWCYHPAKNPG